MRQIVWNQTETRPTEHTIFSNKSLYFRQIQNFMNATKNTVIC